MMNRNQVQEKLIEVARAVRAEMDERYPQAKVKALAEGNRGGGKKHHGRFWREDRGFKYIDDVEDHLHRLFVSFDMLDPAEGSSVFEIGPGNCYLLFMCREMRGCRVAGVDWKLEEGAEAVKATEKPFRELGLYAQGLFRKHLGLEEAVRHQIVRAFEPVAFDGRYDTIVATHTAFNLGWSADAYRYWLRDCYEHLNPDGRLMLALNKIKAAPLDTFPFLVPPEPTPGFKKLTLIPRATIAAAVADGARGAT